MAEEGSLEQPIPQLFGEADNANPQEVKWASQEVAGLIFPILHSAALPARHSEQAAGGGGVGAPGKGE